VSGDIALLLVDLQRDFLERPGLVPDPQALITRAARLLEGFRARDVPVAHAHTVTRPDGSDRMPHWKERGVVECVDGSPGVQPPAPLVPRASEPVVHKQYFSAFGDPQLENWLRKWSVERLVVAGTELQSCVRATVLDAYERGYEVWLVGDVVGSTDPVHGELSRAYLDGRAARLRSADDVLVAIGAMRPGPRARARAHASLPVAVVGETPRRPSGHDFAVHHDPCLTAEILSEVPLGNAADVAEAAEAAAAAQRSWSRVDGATRGALLERWAANLESHAAAFADALVAEVAKPVRMAEDEVRRAVAHVRGAAGLIEEGDPRVAPGVVAARRAVGVVGLAMPWNNPLAIPAGKIAPALAFGNGVVFKPSPLGSRVALALIESLAGAGAPPGLVNVVLGGEEAARALCAEGAVTAVSLTGSVGTGRVFAALCARTMKPLQAELGGNNATIVLADADLEESVPSLLRAAFGFAGQRCTAIRRFVVEQSVARAFEDLARQAIDAVAVGDPHHPGTDVGPLISAGARDRVMATVHEARGYGAEVVFGGAVPQGLDHGAWLAPTLLAGVDPGSRVAQEETFGPVAVLLTAADLEEALAIANGVPHGLVLGVHTGDERARARVLEAGRAGIIHLGTGPLPVHPDAPFGGWKVSGVGPPEHGVWDGWFHARPQAVYEDAGC
jgi:acyl-CoA reductase-like NAD-dependent aldehyde dehydrogenase/nicotinamidase-related amidase